MCRSKSEEQKLRVPRWCWDHSSQPVARFRPLLTCLCRFLADAPRDLARAPGLPPTGQTNPTPRDSILPSTFLPVRLDQRFAIDPCSPSLLHLAVWSVTSLEPRTLRQTGKHQKLSKNDLVLHLQILQSIENARLYVLAFQSSAWRSQAGVAKLVQRVAGRPREFSVWLNYSLDFGLISQRPAAFRKNPSPGRIVKIPPETAPAWAFNTNARLQTHVRFESEGFPSCSFVSFVVN